MKSKGKFLLSLALTAMMTACSLDQMESGSKIRPLQAYELFPDQRASFAPPAGTVPRGHAEGDDLLYRGEIDGKIADVFPFAITLADLERGRQRFDIHCAPCHGRTGEGNGIVAQRGFSPPPTYFQDRLIHAPVGHFYQVIANGWGAMLPYGDQVGVQDRWRIAAYIRVLQASRDVNVSELSPEGKLQLEGDTGRKTTTPPPVEEPKGSEEPQ